MKSIRDKNKEGVLKEREPKCVISAKIPPELLEKMDEMQEGLCIETRNELIVRSVRLYYANYIHGIEKGGSA